MVFDPHSQHRINRAQVKHWQEAYDDTRQGMLALCRVEHGMDVINMPGACTAFVSSVNRLPPVLDGQDLSKDEESTMLELQPCSRGGRLAGDHGPAR